MTAFIWPDTLGAAELVLYLGSGSNRFVSPWNGAEQVSARPAVRWLAELTVEASGPEARFLDAIMAGQRGGAAELLLPDFRQGTTPLPPPAADYAATIGTLGFTDGTSFADGSGLVEGGGSVRLVGGGGERLVLAGVYPGVTPVAPGRLIETAPGRVHLILTAEPADADGHSLLTIAPPLRQAVVAGPPQLNHARLHLRLVAGQRLANPTNPDQRSRVSLHLEEVL